MSENHSSWDLALLLVFAVKAIFLRGLTVFHKWIWKRRAIPALHVAAVLTGFIICNLKLCFYFNLSVPTAQDSFQMFRHDCLKVQREVLPLSVLIVAELSFGCEEVKNFFMSPVISTCTVWLMQTFK